MPRMAWPPSNATSSSGPNSVLLDVTMKGMNGIDVLLRLRELIPERGLSSSRLTFKTPRDS